MNGEKPTTHGRSINTNEKLCKKIILEYYDLSASKMKKLSGYEDLNFHLLPPISRASTDKFEKIDDICPSGYVLKIINPENVYNGIPFVEAYIDVLLHLNKKKMTSSLPIKNKYGQYYSQWTELRESENDRECNMRIIILLTYQDAEELQRYKCNRSIAFSLGQLMSDLHLHLEPFHDIEAFKRPEFTWNLESLPSLRNLLNEINLSENQRIYVERVMDEFQSNVLSKLNELEKGVIHNDLNDANLLVKCLIDEKLEFVGVIDFTDMLHTAYLFEIAITACYLCLNNPNDPINLTASLIAGYKRRHLTDLEYNLLKICICARFVQSLVKGLYAYQLNPTNEYFLTTHKEGWKLLQMFYDMNNEHFVNQVHHQHVDKQDTTT